MIFSNKSFKKSILSRDSISLNKANFWRALERPEAATECARPECIVVWIRVELQGIDVLQILLQDRGPGPRLEALLQEVPKVSHKSDLLGLSMKRYLYIYKITNCSQ
jgi:hypothetical protein